MHYINHFVSNFSNAINTVIAQNNNGANMTTGQQNFTTAQGNISKNVTARSTLLFLNAMMSDNSQ
jgi:hypothetical protein